MKKRHKRDNTTPIDFEASEGDRTLLCRNESGIRSPSLDLGITPDSTEEELLEILANILVEGFLWQHEHGTKNTTESSDILPSFNKRTS